MELSFHSSTFTAPYSTESLAGRSSTAEDTAGVAYQGSSHSGFGSIDHKAGKCYYFSFSFNYWNYFKVKLVKYSILLITISFSSTALNNTPS